MNGLKEKILSQLKQSEYWTTKTRENGKTIQGLSCPACGSINAGWCYAESPLSINCNRMNQCGARTKTIELFDIRKRIEDENPPTKSDPKRPARLFLESRGIKSALKGLNFSYWKNVRDSGSGAVMFPVGKSGANGKTVLNGRLISPKSGDGKTHNSGSTSGQFWQHPGTEYDPYKPVFCTEGIIDALSIIEMGHQAIAVLSAGQDPSKVNLSWFKKLFLAFDNDQAGAKATKKWKAHYSDAETIMPDQGQDFNDILCSGPIDQAAKWFSNNLERYYVNATLALAKSARKYAEIYNEYHKKAPGLFTFEGCTFFSELRVKGESSNLTVERCGRFTFQVISYLRDTSNPDHPEYRYQLKITPKGSRPVIVVATGRDLATPRGLKEFLLSRAKVAFEANASATTAICTMITSTQKAPEVDMLSLTGYDIKTGWYVYKHFAIDKNGKMHLPDKRGLYKINFSDWSTPPSHAGDKAIKPAEKGPEINDIHQLITAAFGHHGAAAVGWMAAGFFVNQIKAQIGFFPFLSLHGDPASGKSALTVTLNALQGVDGEGLPLSQLNTKKALARSISRISGAFVALLEDNQRNERAFDYSILLTGFNSGPLQMQAAFSNDNRTKESPFQGSLMFVQNTEPFNQKAEKQRVISLYFEHTMLTDTTREAYEQLAKIQLPELARTLVLTLQQRKVFEAGWQKAYLQAIEDLSPLENRRILQNHALILAFYRIFCQVHKIKPDLLSFIKEIAQKKCQTSETKDYTLAEHFFETIDQIDEEKMEACLHLDEKKRLIYFNLPGIEQLIRNKGIQFSVNEYLTKSLTQHPAFIETSRRHRYPADPEKDNKGYPKQRRSWVFDANKFQ